MLDESTNFIIWTDNEINRIRFSGKILRLIGDC